ncbi:MAG: HPr family phosphocarrier protein [Anaerolineales bacterium]
MEQISLTVLHPVGLHARPATLFVETAKRFQSTVKVRKGEKEVNAKSILSVLSLGVKMNDEIILTAEGTDEEAVLQAMKELILSNFGEGETENA